MIEALTPPRLRLVVPCYNEAARLDRDAFLAFARSSPDTRILFVDDGSTDATLQVLRDLEAGGCGRIEVLALPHNQGKAEAVRQGMLAAFDAGASFFGFWDADLATPLNAAALFLALLDERPGINLVTGARVKLLGRDVRRRGGRHYLGRVYATAASLALGLAVYDTQCGAKVFRDVSAVRRCFAGAFRSSWVFDVEILARYVEAVGRERAEASIYEFPLPVWIDVPGSKVRLKDGITAIRDLARIWVSRRKAEALR
jgi:glycosyltransferase involved in cell wall biosynthesis